MTCPYDPKQEQSYRSEDGGLSGEELIDGGQAFAECFGRTGTEAIEQDGHILSAPRPAIARAESRQGSGRPSGEHGKSTRLKGSEAPFIESGDGRIDGDGTGSFFWQGRSVVELEPRRVLMRQKGLPGNGQVGAHPMHQEIEGDVSPELLLGGFRDEEPTGGAEMRGVTPQVRSRAGRRSASLTQLGEQDFGGKGRERLLKESGRC